MNAYPLPQDIIQISVFTKWVKPHIINNYIHNKSVKFGYALIYFLNSQNVMSILCVPLPNFIINNEWSLNWNVKGLLIATYSVYHDRVNAYLLLCCVVVYIFRGTTMMCCAVWSDQGSLQTSWTTMICCGLTMVVNRFPGTTMIRCIVWPYHDSLQTS